MEAELKGCRLSSEKFSKAFYSCPVMMTITEPETGRMLEVNDSFCTTLELNLWVHPEKRDDFIKMTDSREKSRSMELEIRGKIGNILVGLFFTETLTLDNKKYILSTIIDIAKQKETD